MAFGPDCSLSVSADVTPMKPAEMGEERRNRAAACKDSIGARFQSKPHALASTLRPLTPGIHPSQ